MTIYFLKQLFISFYFVYSNQDQEEDPSPVPPDSGNVTANESQMSQLNDESRAEEESQSQLNGSESAAARKDVWPDDEDWDKGLKFMTKLANYIFLDQTGSI